MWIFSKWGPHRSYVYDTMCIILLITRRMRQEIWGTLTRD